MNEYIECLDISCREVKISYEDVDDIDIHDSRTYVYTNDACYEFTNKGAIRFEISKYYSWKDHNSNLVI